MMEKKLEKSQVELGLPTLSEPIALAYVPTEHSKIGTELGVKIRGKIETSTVVKKPFFKK